jgi:hypothetical protein
MVSNVVNVFVEVLRRLAEIGAIDIGDETEIHRPIAESTQSAIGHLRPKERSAYPDVHDVADALAGMADISAVAYARGKFRHRVEHLVNIGDHVGAVNLDAGAARGPESDMKHGAAFRDVDLLTGEHVVASVRHAAFLGKPQQQAHRFGIDTVLGIIQK